MLALSSLVLSLLLILVSADNRNPYKILGVGKNAPVQKIKKAFRSLSRKLHPDRNPNDAKAAEKFSDITWAHEVLSNNTLRAAFDRGGEDAVKMMESGRLPNAGTQFVFPSGFAGGFPRGFPGTGYKFQTTAGGHPFFGGGTQLSKIDWFQDSAVEFNTNGFDAATIQASWPDIFFVIRADDSRTENMAKEFVNVAEIYDAYLNFQAIDCRPGRAGSQCHELSRHRGHPFETAVVFGTGESSTRVAYSSPKFMAASELQRWVDDRVPGVSARAGSARALSGLVVKGKPTVVLLARSASEVPVRLRQWASEQKERAVFVLCSSAGLRAQLLDAVVEQPGPGGETLSDGWASLAVLVADPKHIAPETVEWVDMKESEYIVDWILAKWVGLAKKQVGPYSAKVVKKLTPDIQQGHCNEKDTQWCLIYTGPLDHALYQEFKDAIHHTVQAKYYYLDNHNRNTFDFIRAFGIPTGKPSVIALKGKRRKFLTFTANPRGQQASAMQPASATQPLGASSLIEWLESLHDSGILMRNGQILSKVPKLV
ncbi:DnaJ [Gregarina niphandrodes]|uniref:DnaJ n=1 Tax=Gregarina niphandrodes TaxID=110365 RepID=A0A023B0E4_GRENI|nr:DnaJ [Gregarina niphandrodes]EZG45313.1 DnaJ [Gregarina niphandrodes]|eukprot:XP_011132528.1 DnaJ [Gregarina niphandrodes]